MLHLHFGAGRLGLGLVVPAFQSPRTQSVLMNRAVSGANATGDTALGAARRNMLLRDNPDRTYRLRMLDGVGSRCETIGYDSFHTYDPATIRPRVRAIAQTSAAMRRGIVVTASVLKHEHYGPVVESLNTLSQMKEAGEAVGPIALVACENTVSAQEVLDGPACAAAVMPSTRRQVVPVAALVDRMCVEMEEDGSGPHPVVCVRTEPYASLKLELTDRAEFLRDLCEGSAITWPAPMRWPKFEVSALSVA